MTKSVKRAVLAYSGGLDTSIIVPWLKEHYGCEVVCYCSDVGQGAELDGLEARARQSGADDVVVEDLRETFVRDFCFPALRAGAVYEDLYLLGTSLARPLIAARQVACARATGADALAHGCTGKGNDQVRFELTYLALAPELIVIAPWRDWDITSREDALSYAEKKGIRVPVRKGDLFSRDGNLWHLSHEGGPLEDPGQAPPESMYRLTASPGQRPAQAETVTVGFERGNPVSVNGHALGPVELVQTLNTLAARHGVGRVDLVESRLIGMKSRGVYETPGGTVLHVALQDLCRLVLPHDLYRTRQELSVRMADLIYNGQWFSPLRVALQAFMDSALTCATGEVTVELAQGRASAVGRTSSQSLYNPALASFDMTGYDAQDSRGFIKLFGLPLATAARRNKGTLSSEPEEGMLAQGRVKASGARMAEDAELERPGAGTAEGSVPEASMPSAGSRVRTTPPMIKPNPVWQGRISEGLDPRARALNDSLGFDRRLWPEELELSRAYAQSLRECGVLDADSLQQLLLACDGLETDLSAGAITLEGEDVHSAVEAQLVDRCGDPGRRLHTGRSRNDQVATLLRMRVMNQCGQAIEGLRQLERALVRQASGAGQTAVAAYTHLQPAQPVLLGHWWMAHVEALSRDEERMQSASEAADRMPLGSGAIAGTPLVYDRAALATRLGFSRVAANSLDAVGDRDFVLEYLQAAAQLGVHLSRLAEDLVLWCSPGFGWFAAPAGFSTGSSLLPQKRNPDLFELMRAKCGRLIGNAERIAVLLKGLPSGYQKDLQEDKEAVFDTADTLTALLDALPAAIAALQPNADRMAATLTDDLLAVELADALVAEGVPFRDAHARVGKLWAAAEAAKLAPSALTETARLAISPHFTSARLAALSVESALTRRNHEPGTGPKAVARQIARAEGRLGIGRGLDEEGTPSSAPGRVVNTATANEEALAPGLAIRRAKPDDVPGIAGVIADYVLQGVLLPRPVSELYQCVREFHVVMREGERGPEVVACAALRLLWGDLGEVRSLAVRPDHHGLGLGAALVRRVIDDARDLSLPRVIALTREVEFFERCGFTVQQREHLPRKVWTDCVRCPRRHACDEVAVVCDLVPGATEAAMRTGKSWTLPIPPPAALSPSDLPIVS